MKHFFFAAHVMCVCRQYVCIIILVARNNKGVSLPGKLWERSKKIAWKGGRRAMDDLPGVRLRAQMPSLQLHIT